MNSYAVIFGQPYRDTGELFIGTKSALAWDVVLLCYTRLKFFWGKKKSLQTEKEKKKTKTKNTSSLPDFFFLAAELWVRWRCLLFRASRDSSFLSYWTTWQPWTTSTCSCTFPFTFLRGRARRVNAPIITTRIMIYVDIINKYKAVMPINLDSELQQQPCP